MWKLEASTSSLPQWDNGWLAAWLHLVALLLFDDAEVASHDRVLVTTGGHLPRSKVAIHKVLPTCQCLLTQGKEMLVLPGREETNHQELCLSSQLRVLCLLVSFRSELPRTNQFSKQEVTRISFNFPLTRQIRNATCQAAQEIYYSSALINLSEHIQPAGKDYWRPVLASKLVSQGFLSVIITIG